MRRSKKPLFDDLVGGQKAGSATSLVLGAGAGCVPIQRIVHNLSAKRHKSLFARSELR
jgi:hypothetical protein